MNQVSPVLVATGLMLAVGLITVLAWFIYSFYLDRVERRLAGRKGLYRGLVSELAARDRALLEPTIYQMRTLSDLDALEAVLEEQARSATDRPGWLLDVYDRLGLVDKYIERLKNARKWRDRAFAAELLGRVGSAKAVPALLATVQATQTEDSDVREIALRGLARIGDPGAVEPLISALDTAEPWLAPRIADILARHGESAVEPLIALLGRSERVPARAWAANVLGEVRAHRAFPLLVRSLDDADAEVRGKSATALGRLGDHRAVAPLLQHLLTDSAPFVRARIASALAQFGGPEVIDQLVRTLGDSAWWVRMRGVEALEQIGASAEGPLLIALGDVDPEIRRRAAVALERLGTTAGLIRAIEAEQSAEAVRSLARVVSAGTRELVAELLVHPSRSVREIALTTIGQDRRLDVAPEVTSVASSDAEPAVRALALRTLCTLRVVDCVPVALASSGAEQDPRVRLAAIVTLGELGSREVVDTLRSYTGDASPEVRAACARALGSLGGRAVEGDLLRLLGDPHPQVREAAIAGVTQAGLAALAPAVGERIQDADPQVRRAAVQAASVLGDREVIPALLQSFSQTDPDTQYAIILAVSRLEPAALSELIDTLTDRNDTPSRLVLARSLGHLRWANSLEQLQRLAVDSEPEVRGAAIHAIGRCKLAGPLPEAVTRRVEEALRDPSPLVRVHAVDVCSRFCLHETGRQVVSMLERDPAPEVRERAALAMAVLRTQGGEQALISACRRDEPPNVRAAAVLGAGAYNRASMVTLILEMPDQAAVRQLLRERLKLDPWFRLLGRQLPRASEIELRALAAPSGADELSLAEGVQQILDAGERVRLITGLRAFQGEHSRVALLQIVRSDPSAEVRTAALTAVAELLETDESLSFGSRALGDPSVLVRRAAVALFGQVPPQRAFPRLLLTLRIDEDPAVLAAVARLAEQQFSAFRAAAMATPLQDTRAGLVARICRYVQHSDLSDVLSFLSRSGNPEVREAVAGVWRHRPDATDPAALASITADPVISVRLVAAGAAAAAERYDLLDRMTQDPDPSVRREVAVALGQSKSVAEAGLVVLEHLESDPEMMVRAAAHVARLLQGVPVPLPPGLDPRMAAEAVHDSGSIPALRTTARSAAAEERRLAAALALALVQDEVAREVARGDPAPSIRHRVGGALELSLPVSGELP